MSRTSGILLSISVLSCLPAFAQTAPKGLTARELFYAAAEAPKPSAAPATPKQEAAPKPPQKKSIVAKRVPPAPAAPIETAHQENAPVKPAVEIGPAPVHAPDGAAVVQAAAMVTPARAPAPQSGPALGLRYSILKLEGGRMVEVPADTVFHTGDRIQFSVQTNVPGYLYIVSQGSSGIWNPMFPSAKIADGNNRIEGFKMYTMPPTSRIIFDEQKGIEKVFIVFSREPEADLEDIIYSLQAPKKPASTPVEAPKKPKTLVASVNIDDNAVGRLRKAYSRDLIVENVGPDTAGERKETAMYVVNTTGSSDSRVVADLSLVHK
ncbi:MAG TPA: DUF4384 domain-containing protein [Bryobacteraceae bacterium]|jgi:hypothetical protein